MARVKLILGTCKLPLAYGCGLGGLLFLLKGLEHRFVVLHPAPELYGGSIAVLFTGLGAWLASRLSKPKVETVVVEKAVYLRREEPFVRNEPAVAGLRLSPRELAILDLMARGHSNQEIADALFVSLSTVKTHNQNIFLKLDAKRRTQAVEKAKILNIIP